jgi:myo-inositol 2-dehydrogenase/D-chiro-inositol 1-dehydrogenase
MVEFIQCIQQGRKPEITVYDGTAATVVTYAITESFHTGKPVKIKDFL